MRTCGFPGCLNPHIARNLCTTHYSRWHDLTEGFESIVDYVEEGHKSALTCDHHREGNNLLLHRNGKGDLIKRCRQCNNNRQKFYRENQKKNAKLQQTIS